MAERNATAAVVGAGDFIGAAIAKKFAAEGFTIFAGRRNADKLAPLVNDIEAAGGKVVARGLDARKEEDITAFLRAADAHAPLEVCIRRSQSCKNIHVIAPSFSGCMLLLEDGVLNRERSAGGR